MTLEKCEATAGAYAETPTAQMIQSIPDDRLHDLNVQAFACMRLGGRGVRYGYQLKNLVDTAYAIYVLTNGLQNQEKDTVKVASDLLTKVVDHNNGLVDKYNGLAAKYNALLSTAQALANYADQLQRANNQMYTLAAQALGAAGYSQPAEAPPSIPSTIYVRQSPLRCTTQVMPAAVPGLASFAYTNCF